MNERVRFDNVLLMLFRHFRLVKIVNLINVFGKIIGMNFEK